MKNKDAVLSALVMVVMFGAFADVGVAVNGEDVSAGSGDGWTYENKVLTLSGEGPFTLSGTNTAGEVRIRQMSSSTVTLSDLVLESEESREKLEPVYAVGWDEGDGSTISANLLLKGDSRLQNNGDKYETLTRQSGIFVSHGSTLRINTADGSEDASLTAIGGTGSAGIGGGRDYAMGKLVIDGGKITAKGGTFGAGIGGGVFWGTEGVHPGTIEINGGLIRAEGNGWNAAGIGRGGGDKTLLSGEGYEVIIKGGTVVAVCESDAGDIIADRDRPIVITGGSVNGRVVLPQDTSSNVLWRVTVDGVGSNETVKVEGLPDGYGVQDVVPVDGKLNFWLPNGSYFFAVDGFVYMATVADAEVTAARYGIEDVQVFSAAPWQDVVIGYTVIGETAEKAVLKCIVTDADSGQAWTNELREAAALTAGRHQFTWNEAKVKSDNCRVTLQVEFKCGVQLWENGPYWAESNVGAETPEEFGYYFWWGDTVGYRLVGSSLVAADGSGTPLPGKDCPTQVRNRAQLEADGYIDADGHLTAPYDAASAYLGNGWRMPTQEESEMLSSKCSQMTPTLKQGLLITGNDAFATRSIFLPAAGGRMSERDVVDHIGSDMRVWTSTVHENDTQHGGKGYGGGSFCFWSYCYECFPIRAVRDWAPSVAVPAADSGVVAIDNTTTDGFTVEDRCSVAYGCVVPAGCAVLDDGAELISSAETGSLTWQPRSFGRHVLTWSSGELTMATVADVVAVMTPTPKIEPSDSAIVAYGTIVSLSCDDSEAKIYYTTDGSDPTVESQQYVQRFRVLGKMAVKAIAVHEGLDVSDVAVARYAFGQCADPVIRPSSFEGSKTIVEIACATEGAEVFYTLDGTEPSSRSLRYEGPFVVRETTTIRAFSTYPDYFDSSVVTHVVTKKWTIGDSVGLPDQEFSSTGDAPWGDDDGVLRSGAITNNQQSGFGTTFVGGGRLSFDLKVSCEEDDPEFVSFDHAEVWIDGELQLKRDGVHDWEPHEFVLDEGSSHTVEWKYVKDGADVPGFYPEYADDCAWVRKMVWMPNYTHTSTEPVETAWLKEKFPALGDYYFDYEEKAKADAANGMKVWECYVAGLNPTAADATFSVLIRMSDAGEPILSWDPALNGETEDGAGIRDGERHYSVFGKRDLADGAEAWTPVAEGEEGDYRFFKVEVGLPKATSWK